MRAAGGAVQRYVAGVVPSSPDELSVFLRDELSKIQSAYSALADGQLDLTTVAPTKPRDGMTRYAAAGVLGTLAGMYSYYGGSWSFNGGPLDGTRNKLRNGDFSINQMGVSGTVTLAAGDYGHDMWKAGAAGCTYTFSTVQNITTITITSGSLNQVIEGIYLQSSTYCLSWAGTAQGKIGSGAYGASGITGTAAGGTNLNIEFGIGTLRLTQFELGLRPGYFEFRLNELQLCQRHYRYIVVGGIALPSLLGVVTSINTSGMMADPLIRVYGGLATRGNADNIRDSATGVFSARANTLLYVGSKDGIALVYTTSGWTPALTAGAAYDFGLELTARL